MKKIFIVLAVILLLMIAAIAVFIATFDANRYKGVLISKIEESIDKNVRIGSISLNPLHGLAVKVEGAAIKDKGALWENYLVKASEADISLKLLPLLKKDVQIKAILIERLDLNIPDLPLKAPVENIYIKAGFDLSSGALTIERLTGNIGAGSFAVNGVIKNAAVNPDAHLYIKTSNINVADFTPKLPAGSPEFKGGINLDMEASSVGIAPEDIMRTLKAKGVAELNNGVLENMNILKTALDKLNMLPNLVQKLKASLPEKYSGLLNQTSTGFKPIKSNFEITSGRIFFEKLLVESDAFYLINSGSIGMDQDISLSSSFFIPKDLSDAFVKSVPELKYLKNNNGLITMPLEIKGKAPDIAVKPNLDYVMQKLAVSAGQEILNRILSNKSDQAADQSGQVTPGAQPQNINQGESGAAPVEDIIKGVIDIFGKKPQPDGK